MHDESILNYPSCEIGVPGLDDVLGGGLIPNRMYLIEGEPGTGKTTIALKFLLHGLEQGETGLYITLSESAAELHVTSLSHGWNLEKMHLHELAVTEEDLDPQNQYAMFQPSELELSVTTKILLDRVDQVKPKRLVIDSLSEIRLLAQNNLRYRRQILGLKQFFSGRSCTVVLLDDKTGEDDTQLHSIVHGVISLEHLAPAFGSERRRLRIKKFRGRKFRGGYHDFVIKAGGVEVFPRLIAAEHNQGFEPRVMKSGIPELDSLLGGGIDSGTSVLILGPSGTGKTTLSIQYAFHASKENLKSAVFSFDERIETLLTRAAGLNLNLKSAMEAGLIAVQQIDPAELGPGEFAHKVRAAVDQNGASIVIIDSLNGYLQAMPEEGFLIAQLHELFTYLGHKGVVTFLIAAQHGLVGSQMSTPVDATYLADTVILHRYFEALGEVRQAISVLKKRTGLHERSIREFKLDSRGARVGAPLTDFQGVLSGTPQYIGGQKPLLSKRDE